MTYTEKQIERFWRKVDKHKSTIFYNDTRCWEWVGARFVNGHGWAWMSKSCTAHRVSYEIVFGEIPAGVFVYQRCHNRLCVNPEHLNLGPNDDIERFWEKVDKQKSNIFYNGTRCWEWLRGKNEHGYGVFSAGSKHKTILAHRFSYLIENGEIQDGLFVLHHCDNPPCCNPSHLFLGTQKENMDDMQNKGRKAIPRDMSGEKNPFAKLSDAQVAEIRRRHAAGESQRALAREFEVSHVHIGRIVNYIWRKP